MTTYQKAIKIAAICLAISIIVGIFSILFDLVLSLTSDNQKRVSFEEKYNYFNALDIDISSIDLKIITGNDYTITATDVFKETKVKLENNTLHIEENTHRLKAKKSRGKITITVPENLQNLALDMGIGSVDINNLSINKLKINGGAGNINITKSNLNDLDIDAGVGNIYINSYITGNSKIDCGIGKTSILLLGNKEDYEITASKGLGSIKINESNVVNDTTYGSGKNKLKISGGIGDIEVSFK